jgi:hypothetical protein
MIVDAHMNSGDGRMTASRDEKVGKTAILLNLLLPKKRSELALRRGKWSADYELVII